MNIESSLYFNSKASFNQLCELISVLYNLFYLILSHEDWLFTNAL